MIGVGLILPLFFHLNEIYSSVDDDDVVDIVDVVLLYRNARLGRIKCCKS